MPLFDQSRSEQMPQFETKPLDEFTPSPGTPHSPTGKFIPRQSKSPFSTYYR